MLLVGLDRMRTLDMYSGLVVAPLALLIIAASPEEFPASRVIGPDGKNIAKFQRLTINYIENILLLYWFNLIFMYIENC